MKHPVPTPAEQKRLSRFFSSLFRGKPTALVDADRRRLILEPLEGRILLSTSDSSIAPGAPAAAIYVPWTPAPPAGGANAGVHTAVQEAIEWGSNFDGFWDDAANWIGGVVPGANDIVSIDRGVSNPVITIRTAVSVKSVVSLEKLAIIGSLTVAESSSIGDFSLTGDLVANGPVALNGATAWDSGSIGGTATVTNNGTITKGTNFVSLLTNLDNAGTVNIGDGTISIATGKTLTNLATHVVNLSGAAITGGSGPLTNGGILNITGGTPRSGYLLNTGTVNVDAGTYHVTGNGTSSGIFEVDAGATMSFDGGGTFNLDPGVQLNGDGLYTLINFASVMLNGASVEVKPKHLHFDEFVAMPGTGKLTVAAGALFEFHGGTFSSTGGLLVEHGGTLDMVDRQFGQSINGTTLTNHGVWTITTTNFSVFQGGTVVNQTDGVLHLVGQVNIQGPGGSTFNNLGLIDADSAGKVATNALAMNQAGTVHAIAGTISLSGTVTSSGTFNVDAGAALSFSAAFVNNEMSALTQWLGAGQYIVGFNCTVNIDAGVSLTIADLHFNGGSGGIGGAGDLTIASGGSFTLPGGGALKGTGATIISSGATMTGTVLTIDTRPLTNRGTVSLSEVNVNGSTKPIISNQAGATFSVAPAVGTTFARIGSVDFENDGTLNLTGGTQGSSFSGILNNRGAFNVAGGNVVTFNTTSGASTGTFQVAANTTLSFQTGYTFNAGTQFTGAGRYQFYILATYPLAAGVVLNPQQADLSGIFTGAGSIAVPSGGAWTGSFPEIKNLGGFTIGTGASLTLGSQIIFDNVSPTNNGLLVIGANTSQLTLRNGSVFTNAAAGEVRFTPDSIGSTSGIYNSVGLGNGFVNQGLLRRTGGTGLFFLSGIAFTNPGTIETDAGRFTLSTFNLPQLSEDNTQLIGGTWRVLNGATLAIDVIARGNNHVTTVENDADVTLSGAGSTFNAVNNLTENHGRLALVNGASLETLLLNLNTGAASPGPLENTGTIEVGAGSALHVGTDFTQTSAGSLIVHLASVASSGQLTAGGTASLGGSLQVLLDAAFLPVKDDIFTLLSYGARLGNFASVSGVEPLFASTAAATFYRVKAIGDAANLAPTVLTGNGGANGDSIVLSYSVTNSSTFATNASSWTDSFYLSTSPTFDGAAATLLGRKVHSGTLAGGGTYSDSATFSIPTVAPGSYYLYLVTDSRGEVADQGRANNVFRGAQVTITTPTLTLGNLVNGTALAGESKLYKVTLPVGVTRIILTSLSGAGADELYVRAAAAPTTALSDAFAFDPTSTRQTIFLNVATAGDYFILVRGTPLATSAGTFQLIAQVPAFALDEASPTGATNNGEVTLTLRGAQFTANTAITLRSLANASIILTPTRLVFKDASTLYATFNLTPATAPGTFDVVATDGAHTSAIPSGFEVMAAPFVDVPLEVSLTFTLPSRTRVGRPGTLLITVANASGHDLPAPFLILRSDNAQFRLPGADHYAQEFVEFFAANPEGDPTVLPPGFKGSYLVSYEPLISGNGVTSNFTLETLSKTDPLDLSKLDNDIRPVGLFSDGDWELIRAQLVTQLGPNYDHYQDVLRADIGLLTDERMMAGPPSPVDLLHVELDRALAALNPSAGGQLTSTDATLPLGGRLVLANNEATGESFATRSYSDGTFLFPTLTPGSYRFQIDGLLAPPAGSPTVIDAATHATGLVVSGERGASLHGVVHSAGNAPLAGAVVVATGPGGSFVATTEDDGGYLFEGLPAGDYTLTAEASGAARGFSSPLTLTGMQAGVQNFTLGPAAQLTGAFFTPGATIIRVTAILAGTTDSAHRYAVTANNGSFLTLDHLPAGTYDVTIASDGFLSTTQTGIVVAAGSSVDLTSISLLAAGVVSGTVTVPSGIDLTGLGVTLEQNGGAIGGATVGADGTFSLQGVAPGSYTLRVQNASGVTAPVNVTVAEGEDVSGVVLAIERGGVIGGTLRNAGNNAPLAGRTILATAADGTQVGTTTDENGDYTIAGLDAGSYTVFAVGFPTAQVVSVTDLSGATTVPANLAVTFNHTTVLHGILRDALGAAVAQGAVDLVENGQIVATSTVDAQGSYQFLLNRGGTFDLVPVSGLATFAPITGLVLTAGQEKVQDITSGSLALTVTVTGAADPEGAFVIAYRVVNGQATLAGSAFADSNGVAVISNLTPGDYVVRTYLGEQSGFATKTVAANGGLGVALQTAFVLSGAITGPGAAGATVSVSPASDPTGVLHTTADAAGHYSFPQLPADTYTVVVFADGAQTASFPGLTVNAATVYDLTLGAGTRSVTGTVTEGPGLILHSGTVQALDAAGLVVGQTAIRPDGTFLLSGLPTAPFNLRIASSGHTPFLQTNVTLVDGQTLALGNVTLPGVALAQIVGQAAAPAPAFTGFGTLTAAAGGGTQAFANLIKDLATKILGLAKGPQPSPLDPNCPECADAYAAAKKAADARDNFLEFTLKPVAQELLDRGIELGVIFALEFGVFSGKLAASTLALSFAFPAIGSATGLAALEASAAAGGAGSTAAIDLAIAQSAPLIKTFIDGIRSEAQNLEAALNAETIKDEVFSLGKLGKALFDQGSSIQKLHDLPGSLASTALGQAFSIVGLLSAFYNPFPQTDAFATPTGATYKNYLGAEQAYQKRVQAFTEANEKYQECLTRNSADPDCDPDPNNGRGKPGPGATGSQHHGTSNQGLSLDPNDITGPAGVGAPRFVASGVALLYTIRFENLASATAPAAQVKITQQLDADLDFSTFQLTAFGFGGQEFSIPAGYGHYSTQLDLRATKGVFLNVDADLNIATGQLTWTFTAIDPLTGDLPGDADLGFLPPNVTGPEGEGFVSYTVQAKRSSTTGSSIDAQASIVFDANPALQTPAISNTLDAVAPSSHLAALPAVVGPDFTLNWAGATDDPSGSGIESYDLFVSDNNAAFAPLVLGTTHTAYLFAGEIGHTYKFVVAARDLAGNVEALPNVADVAVTVVAPVQPPLTFNAKKPLIFNDANGDKVTVKLTGLGTGTVTLVNNLTTLADLRTLVLTGTNAATTLSITVTKANGGNGLTNVGRLTSLTALGTLTLGAGVVLGDGLDDLTTDLTLASTVKTLVLGDIAAFAKIELGAGLTPAASATLKPTFTAGRVLGPDVSITVHGGLGLTTLKSWNQSGFLTTEQSIAGITVTAGDFHANVDVDFFNNSAGIATMGALNLKAGSLLSTTFLVEGKITSLTVSNGLFSEIHAIGIGNVTAGLMGDTLLQIGAGGVGNVATTKGGMTTTTIASAGKVGNLTVNLLKQTGDVPAMTGVVVSGTQIGNITASVSGLATLGTGVAIGGCDFTATAGNIGNITATAKSLSGDSFLVGIGGSSFQATGKIGNVTATAQATSASTTPPMGGGLALGIVGGTGGVDFQAGTSIGLIKVTAAGAKGDNVGVGSGVGGPVRFDAGTTIGAITISASKGRPAASTSRATDGVTIVAGGSVGLLTISGNATTDQASHVNLYAGGSVAGLNLSSTDKTHGSLVDSVILAGQLVPLAKNADLAKASIGAITISGSFIDTTGLQVATIAARGNLGAVTIGGDLREVSLAAGFNAGADHAVYSSDDSFNRAGQIASVKVTGALINTSIVAGFSPGSDQYWGQGADPAGTVLAGITQLSKIGAITLGAATVLPTATKAVQTPAVLDHHSAIESFSITSLKIGKLPTLTNFTTAGWIDADGDSVEDLTETIVRKISG